MLLLAASKSPLSPLPPPCTPQPPLVQGVPRRRGAVLVVGHRVTPLLGPGSE